MSQWRDFERLLSPDPLLVATVAAHHSDGTSTVTLPGGGQLRVRGQDVAVGEAAFVRGGEIRGPAPTVTVVTLEV